MQDRFRVCFVPAIRIATHASERQRLYRLPIDRIQVCIFVPSNIMDQKVTFPTGTQRRCRDSKFQRQFITRKITNHQILDRLEVILTDYFNGDDLIEKGLPTVQYIAEALSVSPNYLSGLLKVLTGQSTQQHTHDKLIEKAKEKLSTTDLSVSEIAYDLGFQHSQSFSKLFKSKTDLFPLEFRRSFN